jgi:hypothetical protein
MATSYVLAFMIITPLVMLLLGGVRMGLPTMIPNVMPILLTLGLMGAFGYLGFVLSSMNNLTNVGISVGFAVSMVFLANVLLARALLTLFDQSE